MSAGKSIWYVLLATAPLACYANAPALLPQQRLLESPAGQTADVALRQNLTAVAFNERSQLFARSATPSVYAEPSVAKPLNRTIDKGLLLLLLAALVTHQLRRNQRLLTRQLTSAEL
jgi:hypothetical protein